MVASIDFNEITTWGEEDLINKSLSGSTCNFDLFIK